METTIRTICRLPGTPPIPDVPGAFANAHAKIELLTPQVSVQPTNKILPVTLDAYVQANKLAAYSQTNTHNGGTVRVIATDPHYLWNFGDGSPTVVTTSNGGPYPTGDVRHPYSKPAKYAITLRISWHVDAYFFIDGLPDVGEIGPVPADNNPQVTQSSTNAVLGAIEAHAILVG